MYMNMHKIVQNVTIRLARKLNKYFIDFHYTKYINRTFYLFFHEIVENINYVL